MVIQPVRLATPGGQSASETRTSSWSRADGSKKSSYSRDARGGSHQELELVGCSGHRTVSSCTDRPLHSVRSYRTKVLRQQNPWSGCSSHTHPQCSLASPETSLAWNKVWRARPPTFSPRYTPTGSNLCLCGTGRRRLRPRNGRREAGRREGLYSKQMHPLNPSPYLPVVPRWHRDSQPPLGFRAY